MVYEDRCLSAVVFEFVLQFSPYVVWAGTCIPSRRASHMCVATDILYIQVFAGLRVYALHRHWWWATLVFLLSLVPIAVNGVSSLLCAVTPRR